MSTAKETGAHKKKSIFDALRNKEKPILASKATEAKDKKDISFSSPSLEIWNSSDSEEAHSSQKLEILEQLLEDLEPSDTEKSSQEPLVEDMDWTQSDWQEFDSSETLQDRDGFESIETEERAEVPLEDILFDDFLDKDEYVENMDLEEKPKIKGHRSVQRGYEPKDARFFKDSEVKVLQRVQHDVVYLLEHEYPMTQSITFVGNHYNFSDRQRSALTRASCSQTVLQERFHKCRELPKLGKPVLIDGFNLIITLEAALSPETTLLHCMDGTLRDLCGLRGSYRLIESTFVALTWIVEELQQRDASSVCIYLDSMVSNSGRLRSVMAGAFEAAQIKTNIELVPNADAMLWGKHNVVSSDSVILDRCKSWLNLAYDIVTSRLPERRLIHLDHAQCF